MDQIRTGLSACRTLTTKQTSAFHVVDWECVRIACNFIRKLCHECSFDSYMWITGRWEIRKVVVVNIGITTTR